MSAGAVKSKSAVAAIFKDAAFPPFLGIDPDIQKERFERSGVSCMFLNFDEVCDPQILNIDNYKIFINPYGNTFPLPAVDVLMKFMGRGGVIVNPGVPLCHPVIRKGVEWQDLGGDYKYMQQFNIGTFTGNVGDDIYPAKIIHELGLSNIPWNHIKSEAAGLQGVRYDSLTNLIKFEPVLNSGHAGYSVVLYQKSGGIFIWAGAMPLVYRGIRQVSDGDIMSLRCELIKRLALYVLMEKGAYSKKQFKKIVSEKFELIEMKAIKPNFLQDRSTVYPKLKAASGQLVVFSQPGLSNDEYILLRSLQGLVNREKNPELFIIGGPPWNNDNFWLTYLKDNRYIKGYSEVHSLDDLLKRYGYRNAVLVDERLYCSLNIATMIAGMEDVLVATNPEIVKKYGLNITFDLRGKWKSTVAAYKDVYARYKDRFNKKVIAFLTLDKIQNMTRDYLIAHRIFTIWISGSLDGTYPGSDPQGEKDLFQDILAKDFPVNIPVIGWLGDAEGIGIGEFKGINFLSSCGKFCVPSNWIANLTVYSSFPHHNVLKQPQTAVALDKSKVYLSLGLSDGDNLNVWMYLNDHLADEIPRERSYGIGWEMGPSMYDFLPPMAERAVQTLNPNDSIGCATSGAGYVSLLRYADLFGDDRAAVMNDYIVLTEQLMKKLDDKWLWVCQYGGYHGHPLYYCSKIKGLKAIMGGYGTGESPADPAKLTEAVDGVPVFHCAIEGMNNEDFYKNLRAICSRLPRPAFLYVFLLNWSFLDPKTLDALGTRLVKEKYVVVSPDKLGSLYEQAKSSQSMMIDVSSQEQE
jgi:hypothetical protein